MSDLNPYDANERAKGALCTALLIAADVVTADKAENIDRLLNDGVFAAAVSDGYVARNMADWVVRESRYRVACTLGVPVEGRNDPIIDATIAALAIQAREWQARVLTATANLIEDELAADRVIADAEKILARDGITPTEIYRRQANGADTGMRLLRAAWDIILCRRYASRASQAGYQAATAFFLLSCDEAHYGYDELLHRWRTAG